MATRITATEAARNFSDVLNRIYYRGESFVIERSGEVVAELHQPAAQKSSCGRDLAKFLAEHPLPDPDFADDVRAGYQNQSPVDLSDPWER